MTGGHYQVACSQCRRVVEQCRCPSTDKTTRWIVCEQCQGEAMSPERTRWPLLWDRIDAARHALLLRPGSLTDAEQGRVSAYNDVLRWMGPR